MPQNISKLEPSAVWQYFLEICTVPRASTKEGKILDYLRDFARKNKLEYKEDKAGNLVIIRPASPRKEHLPALVLQSHVDMVCEKNSGTDFNFDTDAIQPFIEGQWVKARGTTLGADCGIGMAAQMAVLTDQEIVLPRIEALFTVEEETGLRGARELGSNLLTGKTLINLDSEDEGEIFIGCAGGKDTVATFHYRTEKAPKENVFYALSLTGLTGGHSGDDIHRSLANANLLLGRLLFTAFRTYGIGLHSIEGGNLRNAIPREASAVICIEPEKKEAFLEEVNRYRDTVRREFYRTEPDLKLEITATQTQEKILAFPDTAFLLTALYLCPNGVEAMSQSMPDMVETSTNLASVKMPGDGQIVVTTSQRSSLESKKQLLADKMKVFFESLDATVEQSEGYPGWEPRTDSKVLAAALSSYKELFGKDPAVKAIHAGLECGLFLEKYPDLDMISIGPTVKGVHSPDERLKIDTVKMFYDFLVRTLENME